MDQDNEDLHISLLDDLVDSRQDNLEGQSTQTRFVESEKEASEHVTQPSRASGDSERDTPRVNALRKFASTLYFGQQQQNVSQKNKTPWKNAVRNRPASADPRFRRERSPSCSKLAGQTQSDSKVVLHPPLYAKESAIPRSTGPYVSDQSEPFCHQISEIELKQSDITELHTCRSFITDASSYKRSGTNENVKCESVSPANIEKPTLTQNKASRQNAELKDLHETTASKKNLISEKKISKTDTHSTSEIYLDAKTSLKRHWNNPRLIEKYSKLLKPVQVRKSRSSWTLPLTSPTPIAELHPLCATCVCAKKAGMKIASVITNSYEPYEDDFTESYDKLKLNVYKTLRNNYYMAGFFMIGALCGLILVALVVWVLANDIIWSYMNKEETPKLTGIRWFSTYIGGAILHSINVFCNQLYHMITLQRNEIFDNPQR